ENDVASKRNDKRRERDMKMVETRRPISRIFVYF
ncbi:MAG: hypothetical protein ACI92Z_003655, partial [Paracoccaceae bacterium]